MWIGTSVLFFEKENHDDPISGVGPAMGPWWDKTRRGIPGHHIV